MNFYNIGDASKALCGECGKIVPTSFQLRDVPLSDKSKVVKDVLVSVCDNCGQICGLPQQSLSLVQDTIRKSKDSIEARVSVAVDDLLKTACMKIGASIDFQGTLIRYYAHSMVKENSYPVELTTFINSDLARGKKARRISIKGHNVKADFDVMKTKLHATKYVECIEAVAYKVNEDIINEKSVDRINELKGIYASVC